MVKLQLVEKCVLVTKQEAPGLSPAAQALSVPQHRYFQFLMEVKVPESVPERTPTCHKKKRDTERALAHRAQMLPVLLMTLDHARL